MPEPSVDFLDASDIDAFIETLIQTSRWTLPDRDHAVRCGRFAATMFDAYHALLGLQPADRALVIAAATLHDIGYISSGRDHHRKSFDLIRGAVNLPFSDRERLVVAAAARYHGHTVPNIEHAGFNDMSFDDQRLVRRTTAIVRVGTALDASHLGLIDDITAGTDERGAWLVAYAATEPTVERDRLREAAGGFANLTQTALKADIVVRRQ